MTTITSSKDAMAQGRTRISDAAELRVKESDRIRAVATELAKSTGSKTAGTIGKAVVRGALGGVMRR